MAVMLVASLLAVRVVAGRRLRRVSPPFFCLGAGFMLLETPGLAVLVLLAAVFYLLALLAVLRARRSTQRAARTASTTLDHAAWTSR